MGRRRGKKLGKVLGTANVEAPDELVRLVKAWRAAAGN